MPPAERKSLSISTALALQRAIERRGCLVCAVQQRSLDSALFWFLAESYSEGPTINKLVESQGFCVNHMRLLLAPENHWQVNFVGEILTGYNGRLAGEALERAEARRGSGPARFLTGRRSVGRVFVPHADCPFCVHLRSWERWTLADIVDFGGDPEVAAASKYTCLPHVLMLIPLTSGRLTQSLAEGVHRCLAAIRAGDHRNPTQAAEFFLGRYPRVTRSIFLPGMATELLTDARPPANAVSTKPWPDEVMAAPRDWDQLDWTECVLCQAVQASDASTRVDGEAQSFCRPHARALLAQAPTAITQQLMEWAPRALEQRLAQRRHRRMANVVRETTCPACRRRSDNTASVLATVEKADLGRLGEARFCIPHLPLVLERVSPEAAVTILDAERDLLRCLHAELGEFFRKSDYRFQHEPLGSEQSAWLRAADILMGSYPADMSVKSELKLLMRRDSPGRGPDPRR
jgi:hypothetical protein